MAPPPWQLEDGFAAVQPNTVYINLNSADSTTVAHEYAHAEGANEFEARLDGAESAVQQGDFAAAAKTLSNWDLQGNPFAQGDSWLYPPGPPPLPPNPPPPPNGPCTLGLSGTWYYECGGNDVIGQFLTLFGIPGRDCSAQGVDRALELLLPGAGGGGVPPGVVSEVNCNPLLVPTLQQTEEASMDAGVPPSFLAPGFTEETDDAADGSGPSGNSNPTLFLKTALGMGSLGGVSIPTYLGQLVSTTATFDQVAADLAGIFTTTSGEGASLGITSDIDLLQTVDSRLEAVTTAENLLFGGDASWLDTTQSATLQQWLTDFFTDAQNSTDAGQISVAETTQLLATTLPGSVSVSEAQEFIDRWNRTVQYWSEGIFTAAQVPSGQSTDFLDIGAIQTAFDAAVTAEQEAEVAGYSDVGTEARGALAQVASDLQGQGTCATIKLQIDQSATLTQTAFSGTLTITNTEGTGSMSNVTMDINITDAEGNPANGEFYVSSPSYSGAFDVVDGVATLPDDSGGTISFTFIPANTAAANGPTQYNLGGTIGFTDPSGGAVTIPVFPSTITVDPQAELQLNYFLQQTVVGQDPFSSGVQPSEPAVLGLLVTNVGGGTANNLSITTAQPQILQNAKGLLDTFQIIGTQVGNQQVSPSLTVDLGDIAPGQTADASFLIESLLAGSFDNFTATFSHSDALGGTETSLIASVTTHTLIYAGDFNYPDSIGATDYLTEETPNANNLPDTIYFSNGTTAAVNIATDMTANPVGPASALTCQVTASVTSGWDYIQIPDPGAGFTLYKVVRADGTVIPINDQAWQTDVTVSPTGKQTTEYELHILDDNSTGSYMVYYRPTSLTPPTVASVSPVSSPQSGPVGSVDISFSEPINPATFTTQNLLLTLNGGADLIGSGVTITQDSPTTFTIGGLLDLTGDYGNYTMTVDATGISDFFGDIGTAAGSASTSWATGTNVPVVVSVGTGSPALRNTPVDAVDVVLSEPINPATFNYQALSLTLDGGSNLITSGVTVTEVTPTTFSVGELGSLTAADGTYDLTVTAGGLVDGAGNAGVGFLSETWTMSTVGPTVTSMPTYIQTPRNIVVPTIDVVFSEPVVASTFTYQNLTYSKPGEPNLITPSITITELSPTEFAISNFNNLLLPIDGTYTFTVSAAGVMDLFGNTGTGSASQAWTLDTAAPAAPTDLAISPSTGVSTGVTDTGSVTLTGTLPETGLSVEVMDGNNDVGYANVDGTTFSIALTLPAGVNDLSVTAIDAAGNVSPAASLSVLVDESPLTITSISGPASSATNTPVDSVTVTFSEAINLSTFTTASLSLTDNGGANLITGVITISLVTGTTSTYEVAGLSGLTTADGTYVLTADASSVQDEAGNSGTGSMSTGWLMDTTPPVSAVASLPAQTTSTSFVITVGDMGASALVALFAAESQPASIASYAFYVSDDGGAFSLFTTVPAADPSAVFVGQAGHTYGFYSIATDDAGNVQPTPTAAQVTVEILAPTTVSSIAAVAPNPRNQPVSNVDVTFSQPVDLTGSSFFALNLTDNGGPNLITSAVTISLISGSTYQIGGLGALTAAEGSFTLTVNAPFISDVYGNPGSGNASISWLMDLTAPMSTVSPLPSETTSSSFTVSVTGSDPSGAGGSMPSGIVSFAIFASTDNGPFIYRTTLTPSAPSAVFTGQAGDTYGFYSIATDAAGNVQPTPAAAQVTVQILAPMTVSSITAVAPNPRNEPVSTVDVTFSQPVDLTDSSFYALNLTDNGGPNLITSAVTISLVSGSTYQIGGLGALTASEGTYTLTVNAPFISDVFGNPGSGNASISWLMDLTAPMSTVSPLPSETTSSSFTVSVTGSDPSGAGGSMPSGIVSLAIFASTNNGPFTYWTTVTPTAPSALFTGQAGDTYSFYSIATDAAGNVQPTLTAAQATTQVVRLQPPPPPASPSLVAADDSGRQGDGITDDDLPAFSGTAQAGTTIQLLIGTNVVGTANVDASGRYTVSVQNPLSPGIYDFSVVASDSGGSSEASEPFTLTIVAAPATPAAPTLLPADSNGSSGGETTTLTDPYLVGTTFPGATVLLLDASGVTVDTTVADGMGRYNIWISSPLSLGSHTFTVEAIDQYSDVSSLSPAQTITVVSSAYA